MFRGIIYFSLLVTFAPAGFTSGRESGACDIRSLRKRFERYAEPEKGIRAACPKTSMARVGRAEVNRNRGGSLSPCEAVYESSQRIGRYMLARIGTVCNETGSAFISPGIGAHEQIERGARSSRERLELLITEAENAEKNFGRNSQDALSASRAVYSQHAAEIDKAAANGHPEVMRQKRVIPNR